MMSFFLCPVLAPANKSSPLTFAAVFVRKLLFDRGFRRHGIFNLYIRETPIGVNKKFYEKPAEKKGEGKGTIQIRTDQGIKLLLIIFGKSDIESIIPTTLEVGGQFDREAPTGC
jgi:hypothetical protein